MAQDNFFSSSSVSRRAYWVAEIQNLSGHFGNDSSRLEQELYAEIAGTGSPALLDHLRLCGAIPESYGHDSSEEKLYSKYTDVLLAAAYQAIGIRSLVLRERSDSADVEGIAADFSFVADAKAFRLSRTAKNQKDFKVQAMDGWKRGKPYAMVVCPIYQLPSRASQIYEQAAARNVCIFTYSHLCVLISLASATSPKTAEDLLGKVFRTVAALNPSKDATQYWQAVNRCILDHSTGLSDLWQIEKNAAVSSIACAKEEALTYLAGEREKILRMSHEEAIRTLIRSHKIDSRTEVISSVGANELMDIR